MQSQIEKIFLDIEENQINIPIEEYKEEQERFDKSHKAIENYIKHDKELQKLFAEYYLSSNTLNCVLVSKYYKEGFKCGARVALEISGWKMPEVE